MQIKEDTKKREISPRKKEIKRNPERKNTISYSVQRESYIVVCFKPVTHSLQAIFTTVNDNWQIACMLSHTPKTRCLGSECCTFKVNNLDLDLYCLSML